MWTLNGIQFVATMEDGEESQIIPRLNPLGGGTIKQIFGDDDRVIRLTAVVIGDSDLNSLRALTTNPTAVELVSYAEGSRGNFLVKKVSYNRKPVYRQTVRQDLSEYSPVYNCVIELYED